MPAGCWLRTGDAGADVVDNFLELASKFTLLVFSPPAAMPTLLSLVLSISGMLVTDRELLFSIGVRFSFMAAIDSSEVCAAGEIVVSSEAALFGVDVVMVCGLFKSSF